MATDKHWIAGVIIVTIWLFLDQFRMFYYDSRYQDAMSFDPFWSLLLLPAFASFWIAIRSCDRPVNKALSLIVLIATLGPFLHLMGGQLGGKTDFPGVYALPSTVTIWLIEALATVVPGLLAGLLWKRISA